MAIERGTQSPSPSLEGPSRGGGETPPPCGTSPAFGQEPSTGTGNIAPTVLNDCRPLGHSMYF